MKKVFIATLIWAPAQMALACPGGNGLHNGWNHALGHLFHGAMAYISYLMGTL